MSSLRLPVMNKRYVRLVNRTLYDWRTIEVAYAAAALEANPSLWERIEVIVL